MSNSANRSISLGVRLISIMVVVVTLILTAIGAFQYSRTKALYTKLVDEGLNAACIRLGGNLGSPLWNFNKEQTAEVLNAEMAQDALVGITVRMGKDTKVFSGTAKTAEGKLHPIDNEAALPTGLRWRTFNVPWEGNSIASGTIYYSLNTLQQTLRAQIVSTIVQALVTDLLLIILISLALSSIVVRPLSALTNIADSLASGNFSGKVVEDAILALKNVKKKLHRDELGALTGTFDHMLENLQARDAELDSHRKNLESLVAERTAALTKRNDEMRLVLDNVDQGLVLVAPDGTLSAERSAVFTRYFGNAETKADACIFEAPNARAYFRLGYEQLTEGFLPVEVVLDQLPKKAERGETVFGLRYQPLMQGEDCAGVLFMINDITSTLLSQKRDREQYEQIRVFERCMRDRNGFLEFTRETGKMVDQVRENRFGSLEERLRVIHTIKGNAALSDVLSVAEVAHSLESAIVDKDPDAESACRVGLVEAWDEFTQRVAILFGERLSDRYELSRKELNNIISGLREGQPTTEIVRQLVSITFEPIMLRFARVEEQLRSLADRLQKAPVEVVVIGEKLRLPPDLLSQFWAVFNHVVRNMADHGFEKVEEREAAGKPPHNQVMLSAVSDASGIEIIVSDDGHGVAWDRVAAKASRLGMPTKTRQDLVNALFSPGFSTTEHVTAISGRGVGLSAVAVAVSELNGSFSLESETGKGAKFTFSFPKMEPADLRSSIIPLSMMPISMTPPPPTA